MEETDMDPHENAQLLYGMWFPSLLSTHIAHGLVPDNVLE
jgi:hypothetical protein